MGRLFKALCGLVLPGSLLFAGSLAAGRVPVLASAESQLIHLLALVIVATGLVLSAAFHRSRLFFAILIVVLGYLSVESLAPRMPSAGGAQAVVNATAALMALNLSLLSLMRDRGVISPPGLRRLLLVAIQAGAVIAITLPGEARAAELLQQNLLEPSFTDWSRISQPAIVVFAAAAVLLITRMLWERRPVDSGLLWALATVFVGFNTRAQAFGIYAGTATLILIVAVLETSYTMAYRDELTSLPGRRALNEAMLKLGSSYAVGMVDVDHFKKFNDTYGHAVGDQVLRKVASKLSTVGGNGKPYRFGGEEFAVIFSGKTVEEAFLYMDRVRKDIEDARFALRGFDRRRRRGRKGSGQADVTVSVGIAGNFHNNMNAEEVLQAADKALYRAKAFGRNCTVAGDAACR